MLTVYAREYPLKSAGSAQSIREAGNTVTWGSYPSEDTPLWPNYL